MSRSHRRVVSCMTNLYDNIVAIAACLAAALFGLSGCAPTYAPGAIFSTPDTTTRAARRRGCVDVSAALAAHPRIAPSSALVAFELGNACDDRHVIDLSRAEVVGRNAKGETKLVAFDPRLQLHATLLDGRRTGSEAIRYDAPTPGASFDEVCVDLRAVAPGVDDGFGVVCFATPGDASLVERDRPGFFRALGGCEAEKREGFGPRDCWEQRTAWETPQVARLRIDLGLSAHAIPTSRLALWRSGLGAVPSDPLGPDLYSGTFDLKTVGFVSRAVYVGGEIDLGFGGASSVILGPPPSTVSTTGPAVHFVGGAIVGAQTIRKGPFQLRGEIFGGGRLVVVGGKDDAAASATSGAAFLGGAWVVEPRAAVDVWLTPDTTLGLWAGSDVLQRGAWSTGIAFAFHSRSFDAR